MFKRVPQPPVNPGLRDVERHDFWTGLAIALVGFVLVVCGSRHLTSIETVEGGTAWETQLVKAFSSGGLQFPEQLVPAPPPRGNDPAAFERWAKQNSQYSPPTWKVRVDAGATAPCPT
ncbi:MAG: hypothetical protein ABSH34_20925 [Verrucomicrobiota bacterium]